MIQETAKLGIAMDFIESKIAKQLIRIRKNEDESIKEHLENEYQKLVNERTKIYNSDYEAINKIIKEMEEYTKND